MGKKYKFLEPDAIFINGRPLFRIQAMKDIRDEKGNVIVKSGDFGGYISEERNLSQKGSCWVHRNSKVFGDARVQDNAQIKGESEISENAAAFGNSVITDTILKGYARAYGNAKLLRCTAANLAKLHGNAVLLRCRIYGYAEVYGNTYAQNKDVRTNITEPGKSGRFSDGRGGK